MLTLTFQLQSSVEYTRTDDKGTSSKSDDTTLSLYVKGANMKGGSEEMVIPNRVYVGGITDSVSRFNVIKGCSYVMHLREEGEPRTASLIVMLEEGRARECITFWRIQTIFKI